MMKTLCVAVVVLSLISVCQAASLVCQNLMKPVDQDPDISGTWHYIAVSSGHCSNSTIVNGSDWPSVSRDITAMNTPNTYHVTSKVKVHGKCINESGPLHFANHSMFSIDGNNTPIGERYVLLQTGCPDCIVEKGEGSPKILSLLSRRKSLDAAEMKEFETQAECLGWSKPRVYNTDHDYENCPPPGRDDFKAVGIAFNSLFCMED